ncbi:MAG: type VI secretion system tip protein VgrG [Planctomycetes bacterium]|nr:type VI secretion system tip protein VgrG [Planctomycetota bacterium]
MAYTQEGRAIQITTPLGADALLLDAFTAEERLSAPYTIHAELLSESSSIDFAKVVGHPVAIMVAAPKAPRYFHGIVRRFRQKAPQSGLYAYEAEIVPWLWLLTQTRNSRVFTDKSVPEILETIFGEHQGSEYTLELHASYPKCAYRVQYGESDFDFVSRLMEEEGIHYRFVHEKTRHVLVLGDDSKSAPPVGGKSSQIRFLSQPGGTQPDEVVVGVTKEVQITPAKVVLRDYDFENPAFDLTVEKEHEAVGREIFDFPGYYSQASEGSRYAAIRLEEQICREAVVQGEGNARHFTPGVTFDLTSHPDEALDASYLITAVLHQASVAGSYGTDAGGQAAEESYGNAFELIPKATAFRPERTVPRPVVRGAQTALVVGPQGEEIHTDQYARVQVQFRWDREGKADGQNVAWVRVAQSTAGKGSGQLSLPRVGWEVVVEFEDGHPDHPIVTGCVYNAEAMPNIELPANKTRGGYTSRSTPGGDATTFNQLRFEDKAGEEQVYLQAEKNLDVRVKNDARQWVGNDRHDVVENDAFSHVKNDRHVVVDNKLVERVGGDLHLAVQGEQAIEITGQASLTVKGDHVVVTDGKSSMKASGQITIKGSMVVVQADSGITLKCGGSEVVVDSSGVTLKGPTVTLDGSAAVKIASGPGGSAGSAQLGSATLPDVPDEALEADESNEVGQAQGQANPAARSTISHSGVEGTDMAASAADDVVEDEKKSFLSFELRDAADNPVAHEPYKVTLPDGTFVEGRTDADGKVRLEGLDPGSCDISFPLIDKSEWQKA